MVIGPFAYEGEEPRENKTLPKSYKERIMVREAYKVNPPYSVWKTLWKGVRPALWGAGAAALLVFAGYFADASVLIEMGVPSLIAVVVAESIRNAIKEYRRRK